MLTLQMHSHPSSVLLYFFALPDHSGSHVLAQKMSWSSREEACGTCRTGLPCSHPKGQCQAHCCSQGRQAALLPQQCGPERTGWRLASWTEQQDQTQNKRPLALLELRCSRSCFEFTLVVQRHEFKIHPRLFQVPQ